MVNTTMTNVGANELELQVEVDVLNTMLMTVNPCSQRYEGEQEEDPLCV